ncbi:MAG: MutS-related protein [bacterium]
MKIQKTPLKTHWFYKLKYQIFNYLESDGDFYIIKQGVFNLLQLLFEFKVFLKKINTTKFPASFNEWINKAYKLMNNNIIKLCLDKSKNSTNISACSLSELDNLFRLRLKNEVIGFLNIIYNVLQSMAKLVQKENYSLTEYLPEGTNTFEITECFHPFLENPVCNSFQYKDSSNLCLLTGPNVSGKSTFLKTVGILTYVAHLGFPVPSRKFKISIRKGMLTTINLTDNVSLGLSHFYAEVQRVKFMADNMRSYKNLLIICDELFRGTNVKDAYDATLFILKLLVKIKSNMFFISSHIIEVADELVASEVDFRCFSSDLKNKNFERDFKINEGVSKERTGFEIVKNEQIKEILQKIIYNS